MSLPTVYCLLFTIFHIMYDPRFLPICKEDLEELGWDYVDVIIISADAYVDHPCFGHAVVGRLFEHEGLRVAILPQLVLASERHRFREVAVAAKSLAKRNVKIDRRVLRHSGFFMP